MSFYDENRLRNGDIINVQWCGTCGISDDMAKIDMEKITLELKKLGHTCIVLNDTGTLAWWCKSKNCTPDNYNERRSYSITYVHDDMHFIGPDTDYLNSINFFDELNTNSTDSTGLNANGLNVNGFDVFGKYRKTNLINGDTNLIRNKLVEKQHKCVKLIRDEKYTKYSWCGNDVCLTPDELLEEDIF